MAMTLPNSELDDFLKKQVYKPYHFNTYAMNGDRLALIVVGTIFTSIGTLAIIARVSNILLRRRKAWYDDWAMIVAYVFSIAFMIASYVSVRWGVGLELKDAPPYWATRAIQAVYVVEIFYYFAVFFVKLSIIFLYLRLAKELRNYFYTWSLVLLGVIVLHFVTTLIVFSAQCIPLEKYWAPSTPGHCIDITAFFYSTSIFTIITDVCMLILPIPTVWKVPYSRPHKIGIIAAFLCGGFSTLASGIRLYSIKVYTESPQPLRDAAPIDTWSFVEINIGICCASIAVIRQFVAASSRQNSATSSDRLASAQTQSPMRQRARTDSSEFWSGSGWTTPDAKTTFTPTIDEIARWPSPTKARDTLDLEAAPIDIDGTPIRQSTPLPPAPTYQKKRRSGGNTALPHKPPMMRSFVQWEEHGGSLTSFSPISAARDACRV